jgi:hypothetical protein
LSSILEALKKAEQESTMGRGAGTPWPAPLPTQTTYRQRPRRWWVPLGIGVALCVAAVVFWQVRQPDRTRPADPTPPPAPLPLPKPNQPVQPPVSEAPKPSMPVTEPQRVPPAKAIVDAPPRQSAQQMRASDGQRIDPKTEAAPVPPERQPIRDATASSEAMPVPAEDSSRRPTGPATAEYRKTFSRAPRSAGSVYRAPRGLSSSKFFKERPVVVRIDDVLQARIWWHGHRNPPRGLSSSTTA